MQVVRERGNGPHLHEANLECVRRGLREKADTSRQAQVLFGVGRDCPNLRPVPHCVAVQKTNSDHPASSRPEEKDSRAVRLYACRP